MSKLKPCPFCNGSGIDSKFIGFPNTKPCEFCSGKGLIQYANSVEDSLIAENEKQRQAFADFRDMHCKFVGKLIKENEVLKVKVEELEAENAQMSAALEEIEAMFDVSVIADEDLEGGD